MNMRFFSPCDQSVFETLPLEALEFYLQNKLKYYNERRFHESLYSLTPQDVYLGQGEKIKKIREIIKQNSINKRIFNNKTRKYQSK